MHRKWNFYVFKTWRKYSNESSFESILNVDKNGNELRLEDTLIDENSDFVSDYESKVTNAIIRQLVEELPARDKEIITLYFGFNGKPITGQEIIANRLKISQSYVSRLIAKTLKRIKKQLEEYGIIEPSSDDFSKRKKDITREDADTAIKVVTDYPVLLKREKKNC